jgi:hypothetical protein
LLYLPPYSPDLNPIEQAFAKLKALLRAKALRTDALWNALGSLVACFASQSPTAWCCDPRRGRVHRSSNLCCTLFSRTEFVQKYPVATNRIVRAF